MLVELGLELTHQGQAGRARQLLNALIVLQDAEVIRNKVNALLLESNQVILVCQ